MIHLQESRRTQLLIAAAVGCVLAVVLPLSSMQKGVLILIGGAAGVSLGVYYWRRLEERIDTRNTLITYFADSPFYLLVVFLGVGMLLPRSLFQFGELLVLFPQAFEAALLLVVACWVAYEAVLFRSVKRYEENHGAIKTKAFYARSSTGLEGMHGREATVVRRCAPIGKVSLGPELWDAESIDGRPLEEGQRTEIRDIEGLRLVVEASSAADRLS